MLNLVCLSGGGQGGIWHAHLLPGHDKLFVAKADL